MSSPLTQANLFPSALNDTVAKRKPLLLFLILIGNALRITLNIIYYLTCQVANGLVSIASEDLVFASTFTQLILNDLFLAGFKN